MSDKYQAVEYSLTEKGKENSKLIEDIIEGYYIILTTQLSRIL